MKFKIIDSRNQIETEPEAFAAIAIAFTQNAKHLQPPNYMFTKDTLTGKFSIGNFLLSCQGMMFRFLGRGLTVGMQFAQTLIARIG